MTPQQLYDYLGQVAAPDSDWREYLMNAAQMLRDQARRLASAEERITKLELELNKAKKAVKK